MFVPVVLTEAVSLDIVVAEATLAGFVPGVEILVPVVFTDVVSLGAAFEEFGVAIEEFILAVVVSVRSVLVKFVLTDVVSLRFAVGEVVFALAVSVGVLRVDPELVVLVCVVSL